MMEVFLLSFLVVLLAVGGMALGLLLGQAPLRRGCAGRRASAERCGGCTRGQRTASVRPDGDKETARWQP